MRAGSLVLSWPVEGARLVEAVGAGRIADVIKSVVFGNPATWLPEATGEEVHAIRTAKGELATSSVDQVGAGAG